MRNLLKFIFLSWMAAVSARAADVRISDLNAKTTPSTNTFLEISDAADTPKSGKIVVYVLLKQNLLDSSTIVWAIDPTGKVTGYATNIVANQLNLTGVLDAKQAVQYSGDISPTQIAGNQNDYNPSGLGTAMILRLNSDATRNITGLVGQGDGRLICLVNIGSQNLVFQDANSGSVATNRFEFGNDITLLPKRAFLIQYDVTTSRWRPFGAGFVDAANIDATISRIIGTEVYQNKTLATGAAGGNNTFKQRKVLNIMLDRVSGTSATLGTSDSTAVDFGVVSFTGNITTTNSNFAEFSTTVPAWLSTADDLKVEYLQFETRGTQTGAVSFDIGMSNQADSSPADPTSFSNWIKMTSPTLTAPVSGDIFTIAAQTLSGWKSSVTAGQRLKIRLDRNDTNTDPMRLRNLVISYVDSQ